MKLMQLRYVIEVIRRNYNISAAAEGLNTSQSGVSKQIQMLEHELGFQVFERKRNRVIGLTEPGQEVVKAARNIVVEMESLFRIREDYASADSGVLTLATTHTHARYILPATIDRFMHCFPDVKINLRQGNPTEICAAVHDGLADIAIGTEAACPFPDLVRFPCFTINRSVVARKDHPILFVEPLTLEEIARYPIIAHDHHRSGHWRVFEAFERKGLTPRVIFGSVDTDVSKTYVERGLGIAILATQAVDPERDRDLGARDVSHLFESSTSYLSLRSNVYLRRFAYDFIEMVSPALDRRKIRRALHRSAAEI